MKPTNYTLIPRTPTIRELPPAEQPQARLLWHGTAALSSSELLNILLHLPEPGLAESLLADYGGLAGLAQAPVSELMAIKGIGPARAAQLKAAFELGRRLLVAAPQERPIVKSPADAANLLLLEMAGLEQEHLRAIILNTRYQVLKVQDIYVGSLNTAVVRVGELFREAIRANAAAIIIAHNHPSGDPTPSPEDIHLTRQIVEAGRLLNIDVLDHLVIGQARWVSLKERGLGF